MPSVINSILKPPSWVLKIILSVTVISVIALAYFGYLVPIVDFLDSPSMSHTIGQTRISAFLALKAIITVVAGFWIAAWLSDTVATRIRRMRGMRPRSKVLITKFLQIFVYLILLLAMLDVLGIDLTTLSIVGGAIGIGIGFGLQKITSNFISGLILLFENSIEIDDLIELPDGLSGYVRHASARYTLIETFDGKEVMVPNEDFVTNRVVNWTYTNNSGRVEIRVGVSYDSDLRLVSKLILEAAEEHEATLSDPEPSVYIDEFGDSSVNFLLYFWLNDVTQGRRGPRSEVMQAIWDKFAAHNIVIPFPQRDINIHKET